jgi:hypothetical protein
MSGSKPLKAFFVVFDVVALILENKGWTAGMVKNGGCVWNKYRICIDDEVSVLF